MQQSLRINYLTKNIVFDPPKNIASRLGAARCNWHQDTKKGRDPKAPPGSYIRVTPRCRSIAALSRRSRRARLRARASSLSHLDGRAVIPFMISMTPIPAIIPARKTTVANKMIDMVYSPCGGETRRPRPVGLLDELERGL